MEDGKAVSLAYTFESLCRFFSNKDASGLLGLPDYLPKVYAYLILSPKGICLFNYLAQQTLQEWKNDTNFFFVLCISFAS